MHHCEVGFLGDKQHTDFTKIFLFLHQPGSESLESTKLLISAITEPISPMHCSSARNE
jgi:hypothetical protein